MASDSQYSSKFNKIMLSLLEDIKDDDEFYVKKPLLAHYTSLANIESILRWREIWLANPTLMNDHEEVDFGLDNGVDALLRSDELASAFEKQSYYKKFQWYLNYYLEKFNKDHFLDTYIFSLSEIEPSEIDGRLSMWRAYGADGNGGAIVFDAGKIVPAEGQTPLMIVRVQYGDTATRKAWIGNKVSEIAALIKANAHEESDTNAIAFHAFERIKLFALTSKHSGFAEEREWRIIYWPDQDKNNDFKKLKSYHNGIRGIEPKLKLNMHEANKLTGGTDKLEDYICNIILGHSRASALNREAMKRMLEEIDLGHLVEKIKVSSIPYRNTK